MEAPRQLGRYVVRGRLGAGGMGEVFRAHDLQLDRDVAVKVVREPSTMAAARLLREAKTMAAITHPNVVPVYDVATNGEDVFVAMELVDGLTLREWLDPGRPWRDVVDVFARAAEGLDAAHRLGLVHRDFKPDNVMVELGVRGQVTRVRVMDFGLATSADHTESGPAITDGHVWVTSDRLTQTGAVVGTPSYLAPEQEAGAAGSPATDQFAFCVALFEGLYGSRPFIGDSFSELSRKKWSGQVEPPPSESRVPQALHQVVLRGLCAMPTERWPTMPALAEAMRTAERDPRRPRGLALLGVAGAGGIAAAAVIAMQDESCDDPTDLVTEVWSDGQRARVREAFEGTDLGFAGSASDRVLGELDDYATRWVRAWPSGCESEAALVQQTCLRGRLGELEAVSDALAQADPTTVRLSLEAISALSAPGACAFEEARPRSAAQRVASLEARKLLERARVAERIGQIDDARALAIEAGRAAAGVDDCSLSAQVLQLRARLEPNPSAGLEFAEAGYFEALRCDAPAEALESARYAMSLHTWGSGDYAAAQIWHEHARAQLDQLPPAPEGHTDVDRGILLYTHAQLLTHTGRQHEALEELAEAESLLRPHAETFPQVMAEFLATRGSTVLTARGPAAALPFYEEGLDVAESNFGAQHPMVAIGYGNLGNTYQTLGRLEDAEQALRRTADLMPRAYGDQHPYVARAHNALAQTLTLRNDWDAATVEIEEGIALAAVSEPDGGPETWRLLGTRAAIASHDGDLESARADMQRIVDAAESEGQFSASIVWNIMKLAEYQIGLGRLDQARYRLDQARDHALEQLQGEAVLLAKLEGTYALLHAAGGDYAAAIDSFDEAEGEVAAALGRESLEWAEIREAHADLLLDRGRTAEARAMFETLTSIYDAVDMPEDAERLRARLAQL